MNIPTVAKEILHKWIYLLRLNDWDIKLFILNQQDFTQYIKDTFTPEIVLEEESKSYAGVSDTGSLPEARVNVYERTAEIAINTEIVKSKPQIEATIVHELLHIMLSYIAPYRTELEMAYTEQIVRTLQQALTSKRRALNGKTKKYSNRIQSVQRIKRGLHKTHKSTAHVRTRKT